MPVLALLCACNGEAGDRKLHIGTEPDADRGGNAGFNSGPPLAGDAGIASGGNALRVHVEDIDAMTIEVITLACAGDCADVEAVARGGNPPYAIEWEDGSTNAKRHVCLDASKKLSVSATDTAIDSDEFGYDAHTAQTDLTATVLDCADGGVATDGGGPAVDGGTTASVYWANWTTVTIGTPGSAAGAISPPGGDVAVAYTGEAVDGSAITGQPSVSGIATVTFTPETTYLSSTVTHGPPASGMIGVYGDANLTQTITFSVPVRDPVLAVITLGNFGIPCTWTFDATPVVLSSGPGVFDQNGSLTASGQAFTGAEGNGVVQFSGTFTALRFTVTSAVSSPDFAAFTVGIRGRE